VRRIGFRMLCDRDHASRIGSLNPRQFVVAATVLVLGCGGGGGGSPETESSATGVFSAPPVATTTTIPTPTSNISRFNLSSLECTAPIVGTKMICTMTGANLPDNLSFSGGNCTPSLMTPEPGNNSAVRRFSCTPQVAGVQVLVTYTVPGIGEGIPGPFLIASAAPPSTVPINDTGSLNCFSSTSTSSISCADPAAIALNPSQDGATGRDVREPSGADGELGFSFALVPNPAGGAFSTTDCVRDAVTGLVWEGKPASGTRNGALIYSNPGFSGSPDFVRDYIQSVNASRLCGFSDWRLPYAPELLGLMHLGKLGRTDPLIDLAWFPNTAPSTYWTDTPFPNEFRIQFLANFSDGSFNRYQGTFINEFHRVRLVRSDPIRPENFITTAADRTEVLDTRTGLTWKISPANASSGVKCSSVTEASMTHQRALACAAEHPGWRIPNVKELASIVRYANGAPSGLLPARYPIFESALSQQGFCWSSTAGVGDSAFGVSFSFGQIRAFPRANFGCLLLVRSG